MTFDEKRLAIMQPYFLPYIGYFQLVGAVDEFVIYDNIKYTKKGWINRNRFLQNGKDQIFSIALQKGSDSLDVAERVISPSFDRIKLLKQIESAYKKAPYFENVFPLISSLIDYECSGLFPYILNSVKVMCEHLGIQTSIVVSSSQRISKDLSGKERVLAICKHAGATQYINAIGGQGLYDRDEFKSAGVALSFLKSHPFVYQQFSNEFVPWLSIVDVLMFNSLDSVRAYIARDYDLV